MEWISVKTITWDDATGLIYADRKTEEGNMMFVDIITNDGPRYLGWPEEDNGSYIILRSGFTRVYIDKDRVNTIRLMTWRM